MIYCLNTQLKIEQTGTGDILSQYTAENTTGTCDVIHCLNTQLKIQQTGTGDDILCQYTAENTTNRYW